MAIQKLTETPMDWEEEKIVALGLNLADITLHLSRIREALFENKTPQIAIGDTCRLDNGGVIGWETIYNLGENKRYPGYVAFVPAAGAGSRYFKPLNRLLKSLESSDNNMMSEAILDLKKKNAQNWCIPEVLKRFIALPLDQAINHCLGESARIGEALTQPKALLPCTIEGKSFLHLKAREHEAIGHLEGQIYIVKPHAVDAFKQHLGHLTYDSLKTFFIEQGAALSTIRFKQDLRPVLDQRGEYSMVPAGHGSLLKLFPEVKKKFPQSHSLFIRNIDNVMGTGKKALDVTRHFLSAHSFFRESLTKIRENLARDDIKNAGIEGEHLLKKLHLPVLSDQSLALELRPLLQILFEVFHVSRTNLDQLVANKGSLLGAMKVLFKRPLVFLGQVPNSGADVGGTPVFSGQDEGGFKVCLEVPHASEKDAETFLRDPQKATHFNPVFVAAEIPDEDGVQDMEKFPYWLMAGKDFRGEKVFYHETILYELISNSIHCNSVFVEVPRLVFNPHKSIEDCSGVKDKDWDL